MSTLEIVKNSITESEYSGYYLIENVSNGEKKLFDARIKPVAITKAIDEPDLGFKVTKVDATWEANRIALLQDAGATKNEIKNDFRLNQQKKVDKGLATIEAVREKYPWIDAE